MSSLGVVALFNSSPDAIALLTKWLDSAGFSVVSALIPEIRDGRCDVDTLMERHDPSVVVYDIGPPYDENWSMFERLRAGRSMHDRRFVITAVNAAQVERLAGRDERIFEVVDKALDLGAIVQAVREAARARETRLPGDDATVPSSNVVPMPERRHSDRRQASWSSDDLYRKLREKREQVETERRNRGRRVTDINSGPHHHAA